MDKELNIAEILKDAPKGTKLYSTLFGECEFVEIENHNSESLIAVKPLKKEGTWTFHTNGHYYEHIGDCLLFPSKENRNWENFKIEKKDFNNGDHIINLETGDIYFLTQKALMQKAFWAEKITYSFFNAGINLNRDDFNKYEKIEKFDPKWLESYDRVLVYDHICKKWVATFFSHIDTDNSYYIMCDTRSYIKCIPFNSETKYLRGTNLDEPKFYKID